MLHGSLFVLLALFSVTAYAPPVPEAEFFHRKMILPGPLRDPLVALVGETCYVSLIEDFNLSDMACIKYALSKALGFGIVLGGSIVKIPQILTILANRSAEGLSLASFLLETASYGITLAYNLRQGNPFSTYGEVLFMAIQNVIITLLILFYAKRHAAVLLTGVSMTIMMYCLLGMLPSWAMSSLYAATIPLILASKVPQIYANHINRSTGQLSVFAVLNYFAGSTARVFTTMTELDDPLMLGGNIFASMLNAILVLQVFLYWGKNVENEKPAKAD
ncbi:hypothetical protein DFQ28_008588 [Apophysomyces sp. BC1034]|nr:hypothetical protein DFQ30_000292 [Apophysomyces sp. BC1015]KAG0181001.1 hypothetical protein DFQ29_009609 [Apophysomyces sp. BC1021]KAG0192590.1 hypothetical protein DFQ28_008588 [Apophysomyces sp. BC1034]